MRDTPVFYDWLNEITDEIDMKAYSLNISTWEIAGLRNDAPQDAKEAFEEFLKEEEYWRHNITDAQGCGRKL